MKKFIVLSKANLERTLSLLSILSILPGTLVSSQAFAGKDPYTSVNDPKKPPKGAKTQVDPSKLCDMVISEGGDNNDAAGSDNYNAGRRTYEPKFGKPGQANDQWCSNHGNPTNDMISPETYVGTAVKKNCGPISVMQSTSDNAGDFSDPAGPTQSECNNVRNKMTQCTFQGGQLIAQCMAYKAAEQADIFQWILLGADIAVTATCASECVATTVGTFGVAQTTGLASVCSLLAVGTGVTEFGQTMAMKSSAVGGMIDAIGMAGGVATGVGIATTRAVADNGASQTTTKVASCVTAGIFAVMSGIRVAHISDTNGVKSSAASAIQDLASAAPDDGTGGAAKDANGTGNGGFNPNGTATAGWKDPTATTGSATQTTADTTSPTAKCAADPACSSSVIAGVHASATDADLLTKSGANRAVAPLLSHLDLNGLKHQLASGGAGAMMSSALGGSAGELGPKLAEMAQAGQSNSQLASLLGGGGTPTYASSGGGSGASAGGKSDNPFGNLFGAKDAGGMGSGAGATTQFGSRAPASDIWHTGTTQNIFEIVSDKVSKVVSRVAATSKK